MTVEINFYHLCPRCRRCAKKVHWERDVYRCDNCKIQWTVGYETVDYDEELKKSGHTLGPKENSPKRDE